MNGDMAGCKSDCTNNVCGDGFGRPGEGCDDGNQNDNDECTNACALATCGDGVVAPTEACDDGNPTTPTRAPTPAPTRRAATGSCRPARAATTGR
jgi:cysteine-rich repeat protein